MSAIRLMRADRPGGPFTATDLPTPYGLYLPILPPRIRVHPGARWGGKELVGVGTVPSAEGRGLKEIEFGSILPAVYSPLCRGLPSQGHFYRPEKVLGYLLSLYERQDIFLLSIDEGPQGDLDLEIVPGASGGARAYDLHGQIIDEPMRITDFEYELGAFMYVTYRMVLGGTQRREHLERGFWGSLLPTSPLRRDPGTGKLVPVRQPGTNKPIPLTAAIRPGESLPQFTQRWLGSAKVGQWRIIADYNGCDVNAISKGRRLDLAPLVQKKNAGQRLTSIAFPPDLRMRKA